MVETLDPKLATAVRLEKALIAIALATDFQGRKIHLLGGLILFGGNLPPQPSTFRDAIVDCIERPSLQPWQPGEQAVLARNVELLVHGWQAAIAYEEARKYG